MHVLDIPRNVVKQLMLTLASKMRQEQEDDIFNICAECESFVPTKHGQSSQLLISNGPHTHYYPTQLAPCDIETGVMFSSTASATRGSYTVKVPFLELTRESIL